MGSGCFKGNAAIDPERGEYQTLDGSRSTCSTAQAPEDTRSQSDLKSSLAPVLQLAGKSQVPDTKLDEVLSIMGERPAHATSTWFKEWCGKASAKARGGLFLLMQRAIGRALNSNLTVCEELIQSDPHEASESAEFGYLSDLCRDALRIYPAQRIGVEAALLVLSNASNFGQVAAHETHGTLSSIVPALDRLVLLFRTSLVAHITTTAKNRQLWRELERYIGLPPLEHHMSLLSCGAKSVLLNLMLVPDGIPPVTIVVNRERALVDAGKQIPDDHACIVSPYFESVTGTKTVQGRRVEGGEGHGPRKEFFIAVSSDALRRWTNVIPSASRSSSPSMMRISFKGNRITLEEVLDQSDEAVTAAHPLVLRALANACVGDRLQLEFSNDVEAEHLITAIHRDSGVSVAGQFDKSVCNDFVSVRQCRLQKALKPLFEFHRGTGQQWFSAYATELHHPSYGQDLQNRYFTFGKLLMLALANRCKTAFSLPAIFFQLLLNTETVVCLEDLKGFDDDLHSSLKKCLKMNVTQFNSLKEVEGLNINMSREQYVAEKVKETFTPGAMEEIRRGFWYSGRSNTEVFKNISANDLHQMLCPSNLNTDIDIKHIFRVEIEEEMAECKLFVDSFWYIVENFTLEEKKLFLRFVTGLEAPPEPGTEKLLIELPFSAFSKDEYAAMLDMLPQAHTCTNTLELPNYYDALKESGRVDDDIEGSSGGRFEEELRRLLGDKLRMAIRETAGYELDATDQPDVPMVAAVSEVQPMADMEVYDEKSHSLSHGSVTNGLKTQLSATGGAVSAAGSSLIEMPAFSHPRGNLDMNAVHSGDSVSDSPHADEDAKSEDDGRGSRKSFSPAPPSAPSSESLQSLRSDPGVPVAPEPEPPPVAAEPFKPGTPFRLEPLAPGGAPPPTTEPFRLNQDVSFKTASNHRSVLPPLRQPVPFMGSEFGNLQASPRRVGELGNPQAGPPHGSSEIDFLEQGGLTSLFQSRYGRDVHNSPSGKMCESEIDNLIEELELDLRK
jgi:hypothetical protein